jgi:hypothetical protein
MMASRRTAHSTTTIPIDAAPGPLHSGFVTFPPH